MWTGETNSDCQAWQELSLQVSHFTNPSKIDYFKNIYLAISYMYALYLDHIQPPFHPFISSCLSSMYPLHLMLLLPLPSLFFVLQFNESN